MFFLYQARNERIDFRGSTNVMQRLIGGPHFSVSDSMAMAEQQRTPGTVFRIQGTLGILLACDGGAAVVSQRLGVRPFFEMQRVISRLTDRKSLTEVISRLPMVHGLESALYVGKEANLQVEQVEYDAPVYDRKSAAGGARNSLAWSQTESTTNWQYVRRAVDLLNESSVLKPVTTADMQPASRLDALAAATETPEDVGATAEKTAPVQSSSIVSRATLEETQQLTIANSRIGQDTYRDALFARWNGCSVTGCRVAAVLMASHIKPWSQCETARERLDVANGLLLIPNLDRLFDLGLISFDDNFRILLSSSLRPGDLSQLNVTPYMRLTSREHSDVRPYLAWHRKRIFQA
ncbi:HNH endonuclease [Cupriavidus basilensis]|uniref:HNH endonuclease n=1 Tax=Cupriavidus basilensis TaxID=68895 RepID=UPI0020A6666D|nr:HNH endonuclease [Cupriavidus basilensis]MCP3024709.1 HNH endonuclease [Cupriavidus basilensis]